jgi:hypothetical protein
MNLSNHLPGFNMEAEVVEFDFNVEKQTITVVWKMPFSPVLMLHCPNGCPDTVWKEIYGVEDGKLTLLKTIQGSHIPQHVVPETYKFEDDGI